MSCLEEHKHPKVPASERNTTEKSVTHTMIRPQVVDLLIPTRGPNVLANEFDRVEGLTK
jgi:hypothetical protein